MNRFFILLFAALVVHCGSSGSSGAEPSVEVPQFDAAPPSTGTVDQAGRVTFEWEDYDRKTGLTVTIQTDNLVLRSVCADDTSDLVRLFSDPDATRMFARGEPIEASSTLSRIATILKRRKLGNPFHGFSVFRGDRLGGYIVLGYTGTDPGYAELAGISFSEFWNKGYGMEAASAMVLDYATVLRARGFTIGATETGRVALPFATITATSRPDNDPANHILTNLGFVIDGADFKYGVRRNVYVASVRSAASAE